MGGPAQLLVVGAVLVLVLALCDSALAASTPPMPGFDRLLQAMKAIDERQDNIARHMDKLHHRSLQGSVRSTVRELLKEEDRLQVQHATEAAVLKLQSLLAPGAAAALGSSLRFRGIDPETESEVIGAKMDKITLPEEHPERAVPLEPLEPEMPGAQAPLPAPAGELSPADVGPSQEAREMAEEARARPAMSSAELQGERCAQRAAAWRCAHALLCSDRGQREWRRKARRSRWVRNRGQCQ